jgi:activator of 2-hydroxyglutaryl-CoA dehydratase
MIPPASPEAETNSSSPTPDTKTDLDSQPSSVAPMPHVATETFSSQLLTNMQEQVQTYMQERLRILESQLLMDQQRQRDHVEEDLHKMQQQLTITTQEQRQHYQAMSAAFREMLEEMRKELSDTLHRLSRDLEHALRRSEAHSQQAIEKLRDEMLLVLCERDQTTIKRHMLGELLVTLGKQLQTAAEDRDT